MIKLKKKINYKNNSNQPGLTYLTCDPSYDIKIT